MVTQTANSHSVSKFRAVTRPGICYIRAYPLFYAFCFKIKKECRRWDLNPTTEINNE